MKESRINECTGVIFTNMMVMETQQKSDIYIKVQFPIRPSKHKGRKPAACTNENGSLQVSVILLGRFYVYWGGSGTVLL